MPHLQELADVHTQLNELKLASQRQQDLEQVFMKLCLFTLAGACVCVCECVLTSHLQELADVHTQLNELKLASSQRQQDLEKVFMELCPFAHAGACVCVREYVLICVFVR